MRTIAILATFAAVLSLADGAEADNRPPALALERTISLPHVAGRIDHLAVDPANRRLAVAERGNNSVDMIEIASGTVTHRFLGLHEPQGVAFDRTGNLLVVAEGGAGEVRIFDTRTFADVATIPLGDDADNVRIDPRNGHAIVGYGAGALAVIDLDARKVVSRIALPAHPEAFQIEQATGQAFVNLPDARTITVVDLGAASLQSRWRLPAERWNFPMALDPVGKGVAVVFRGPARLVVFDRYAGAVMASQPTCGDSDDVFYDTPRSRIYVICGAGAVDVFDASGATLNHRSSTLSASGARTGLFVPTLDRLFVAARAQGKTNAAILILRPIS